MTYASIKISHGAPIKIHGIDASSKFLKDMAHSLLSLYSGELFTKKEEDKNSSPLTHEKTFCG